jgi:two-component system sensor histidine kinase TctE
MRVASLRAQILRWLVPALVVVCAAGAVDAYVKSFRRVNDLYDRALYASALAISERVSFEGGRPRVDLPPVAFEILDTPAQERVFHRVVYRRGDGPELELTGYVDLPFGRGAVAGRPSFHEASFRGYPVRIAEVHRNVPTDPPSAIVVLVGETVLGREALARAFVSRSLGWELLVAGSVGALVWMGVRRGLRPLAAVSRDVARRSATDLTPLPLEHVPRETRVVVDAVNDLMRRLRTTIDAQDRFIANASHALRTPLAVLQSEAELGLRNEGPDGMRESLARLRRQSQATTHLCTQLLAMARAGHVPPPAADEVLDLEAAAGDACRELVPAALARDVDLGFEGQGPAPIRGREHQIREVIGNLVHNAIEYGAHPGTITVGVRREADGCACLSVEDDGPGIAAKDREAVLEPFHRLSGSPGHGAGLGLAIVNEIAQGHGATVRLLDGANGRGLRVEVRFPAALPASAAA